MEHGDTKDAGAQRLAEAPVLGADSVPVRRLGGGPHGEVWLVDHQGKLEAHKVIARGGERDVFRDALHTRRLDHPGIVRVYGVERAGDAAVLRMEHVEGRDLATVLAEDGCLPVSAVVPIGLQVASALRAAHEAGIVHQDIDPANLVQREDGTVVLTDFGLAATCRRLGLDASGDRAGRRAPAALEDGPPAPHLDVWGLGLTLWRLLTDDLPFDPEVSEPALAPTVDPTADAPWIPAGLLARVRRMLDLDDATAYPTMKAVEDDLRAWWTEVACPACGERMTLADVGRACPDCKEKGITARSKAVRELRAAETAFCECDFAEARAAFERARPPLVKLDAEAELAELDARLGAVAEFEEGHAAIVERARLRLREQNHVACVQEIRGARRRFSRSPELREMRERVRDRFETLYRTTEDQVRRLLREQDFDSAVQRVESVREIVADATARAELRAVLDAEPDDFGWLREEIEARRTEHERHRRAADEAIATFAFDRAAQAYTHLETHFPSQTNLRMLARLQQAGAILSLATAYDEELLHRLIDEPGRWCSGGELRICKARQACRRLLEDFHPEAYPSFERIARLEELLEAAGESVRAFVSSTLVRADRARDDLRVFDELELLRSVQDLVLHTDLVDLGEREELGNRLVSVRGQVARAEELYAEGKRQFQGREYAKARLAFSELQSIAPGSYEDTDRILAEIESAHSRYNALSERVTRSLAELAREPRSVESAVQALDFAAELYHLSDEDARAQQVRDLAMALATHLAHGDARRSDGRRAEDVGVDPLAPDRAKALARDLRALAEAMPDELWRRAVAEHTELRWAICELFERELGARVPPEGIAVARLRAWLEALEAAAPLLRPCETPQGCTHPAQRCADTLAAAYERLGPLDQERDLSAYLAACATLTELAPPSVAAELAERVRSIRQVAVRARRTGSVRRLGRALRLAVPVAVAAGLGVLYGRVTGEERVHRETFDERSTLVADLALEGRAADGADVQAWIVAGGDGASASRFRRAAIVDAWVGLQADLRRPRATDVDPTAAFAATARLARLAPHTDVLASEGSAALAEAFSVDLEAGLDRALAGLLDAAVTALAEVPRPQDAVRREVRGALELLLRAFEREPLRATQAELAELVSALDATLVVLDRGVATPAARGDLAKLAGGVDTVLDAASRLPRGESGAITADTCGLARRFVHAELRRALLEALHERTQRAAAGDAVGFAADSWALIEALDAVPPLAPFAERPQDGELARLVTNAANLLGR